VFSFREDLKKMIRFKCNVYTKKAAKKVKKDTRERWVTYSSLAGVCAPTPVQCDIGDAYVLQQAGVVGQSKYKLGRSPKSSPTADGCADICDLNPKCAAFTFELKVMRCTLFKAKAIPRLAIDTNNDCGCATYVRTACTAVVEPTTNATVPSPTTSPSTPPPAASMALVLTAVADKGTSTECDGEDWVSFANRGSNAVGLEGFMLTDSNGRDSALSHAHL
jgi:hypothetical protein